MLQLWEVKCSTGSVCWSPHELQALNHKSKHFIDWYEILDDQQTAAIRPTCSTLDSYVRNVSRRQQVSDFVTDGQTRLARPQLTLSMTFIHSIELFDDLSRLRSDFNPVSKFHYGLSSRRQALLRYTYWHFWTLQVTKESVDSRPWKQCAFKLKKSLPPNLLTSLDSFLIGSTPVCIAAGQAVVRHSTTDSSSSIHSHRWAWLCFRVFAITSDPP